MTHVTKEGRGGIKATIIADSINNNGQRITTFELEYPRFIHAEFMTHRLFSRNAASSRAIPVESMIENILKRIAMPIHWGKNQPGMQANEECSELVYHATPYEGMGHVSDRVGVTPQVAWTIACMDAIRAARAFHAAGYHKQIVNRVLEPYTFMKVVCTATEYENFFWLRCHKDAQPEIHELAICMRKAMEGSVPEELGTGEWHLPYISTARLPDGTLRYGYIDNNRFIEYDLETAKKVSASCCAQVSYRKQDMSVEKALKIYDALVESKPVHASPFEHQATTIRDSRIDDPWHDRNDPENICTWDIGITRSDKDGNLWSGNFKGWIQNRQLIPDHHKE